jgi:hypothetical protein
MDAFAHAFSACYISYEPPPQSPRLPLLCLTAGCAGVSPDGRGESEEPVSPRSKEYKGVRHLRKPFIFSGQIPEFIVIFRRWHENFCVKAHACLDRRRSKKRGDVSGGNGQPLPPPSGRSREHRHGGHSGLRSTPTGRCLDGLPDAKTEWHHRVPLHFGEGPASTRDFDFWLERAG